MHKFILDKLEQYFAIKSPHTARPSD